MTLLDAILALSQFLVCYALVLAVAWVRAVGALERHTHIGHFVGLMGVCVPGVALSVTVLFVSLALGIPAAIPALAILLPGAIVVGLLAELSTLAGSAARTDAARLATAFALTVLMLGLG